MNIEQAVSAITTVIPEAESEITPAKNERNSFAVIRIFTKYIKTFIERDTEERLFKAISLMERIHEKGDWPLHNAVEQIFVFSLDLLLGCCSTRQRELIISRMPIGLYTAYINQIYRSTV